MYNLPSSQNPASCGNPQGRFLGSIFMKDDFVSFVKEEVEDQMDDDISIDHAALDSEIDEKWKDIEKQSHQYWMNRNAVLWLDIYRTDGTHALAMGLPR